MGIWSVLATVIDVRPSQKNSWVQTGDGSRCLCNRMYMRQSCVGPGKNLNNVYTAIGQYIVGDSIAGILLRIFPNFKP